jgi:hypothetical protein
VSKTVFLSHAGADTAKAMGVARELQSTGIDVRFDRQELRLGDVFLTFMEQALSTSDYCLLLWSRSAADTQWVRIEWEAALYRSVEEKRSFLVAGLLEDLPLPVLLAPRLRADLFPGLQPGLNNFIEMWQADREAEHRTQRPVASTPLLRTMTSTTDIIYVTSDLFGITTPLRVNLDEPAGLCLDRIVDGFGLPRVFDHEGRIGVRFDYSLKSGNETLARGLPLNAQRIANKSVVWLETTMKSYAQSDPTSGVLQPATFRNFDFRASARRGAAEDEATGPRNETVKAQAWKALEQVIARSALGPP